MIYAVLCTNQSPSLNFEVKHAFITRDVRVAESVLITPLKVHKKLLIDGRSDLINRKSQKPLLRSHEVSFLCISV